MRGRRVTSITITLVLLFSGFVFGQDAPPETIFYYLDSINETSLILHNGNFGNTYEGANVTQTTTISDSYKDNTGLFTLNQASGSINNQSNIALMNFGSGKAIWDIKIDLDGRTSGNTVRYSGLIEHQSLIENSFMNSRGVFMVNQSPGNLNTQSNLFLFSMDNALILSNFDLAQHTGGNVIEYAPDSTIVKKDILKDSFSGTAGIAIISQSSGDLNTIRNNIGISFSRETIR